VANEKRQRQDLARAEKLARESQAKVQQLRKARTKRFGIIGGALAAAVAVLLFFQVRSTKSVSDDSADKGKPTVVLPTGAVPTKLVTKDLRAGTGEAVAKGDTVRVKYVGVSLKTKKEFDSNWAGTEPFEVTGIGTTARNVIPGWDGLVGAKVGGRRQLVIPANLAYGKRGSPPVIGPDETLVFVVDILSTAKG
jgi:peptidylprolyl isomerase